MVQLRDALISDVKLSVAVCSLVGDILDVKVSSALIDRTVRVNSTVGDSDCVWVIVLDFELLSCCDSESVNVSVPE